MQAKTVLVTGASGFIGAHCVLDLLANDYKVRATVRTPQRAQELTVLLKQHAPTHTIELAYADLMRDDGWHDAVQGCDYVLHLASPLPVVQPDNPNDLINPARDGALRVIKAARQGGVKRVVLTSSQAAVGGSRMKSPDYIYNENDWTDISDPTVSAYDQSKTIAERAARDYVAQHGDIELVTVNPGLVYGPILEPKVNTSLELVKRLMSGELPVIPNLGYETVDVRDVAVLHRLAMEHPDAVNGRFMASSGFMWLHEMAQLLRQELGEHAKRVPQWRAPSWIFRFLSHFDASIKTIIPSLDQYKRVDHSNSVEVLGWQPRSPQESVLATARSFIDYEIV